ncbi:MAG: magnesium-translocating P-type ATPase [Candidatus Thermoplasmatota archaeon]
MSSYLAKNKTGAVFIVPFQDLKNKYTIKKITHNGNQKQNVIETEFITSPIELLFEKFQTSLNGLSYVDVEKRLEQYGYNSVLKKKKRTALVQFLSKFTNPLVIVLLIIAAFSLYFGEPFNALVVTLMAIISVFISFLQEYRAGKEAEKLSEMVRATATVIRNGKSREVKIREIVPGDIVDLFAGDMIPADLRIISCKDLFINQASLTGESFPAEKTAGPIQPKGNSPSELTNIAFMGTSVISGTGLGLVIKTGLSTQFGEVSQKIAARHIETSFDKGIRSFTWLMIRLMLVLVITIFAINAVLKGDFVEAFLFSIAVAVGLTPEMLPMLVAINLSKGAIMMAKKQVIVKRLNSIQNFGAMDVLCTDKTGTLTMDKIVLEKHCDVVGKEDEDVLRLAYINSYYQTGLKNLLDKAILKHEKLLVKQYTKIDEIPFDFSRKIMSVVVTVNGTHRIISKGAPEQIFTRCSHYEIDGKIQQITEDVLEKLKSEYDSLSLQGFRVLAIAYKDIIDKKEIYSRDDEINLILKGYVAFLDPPKPTVKKTIETIKKLGIELKVLTGDNEFVTKNICSQIGLDIHNVYTGDMIDKLTDEELREVVETTTVFVRLSPLQKGRIVDALRKNNHIVGYLGDGINDAPALKAADVGISVDNAVDIAKESADIILQKKSLMVLGDGVIEGRKTFGNIVKYIKMGASSNFGNMISMTGASIFLPFLPMLPTQILVNNFLYDMSQTSIPTDSVDDEYLRKPRPWNVRSIKRFMLLIGPVSSIFDFVTFGVLWFGFHAQQPVFATGWFLESLCTQTLVIHVIRTGKIPFIESRPSRFLLLTSIFIIIIGLILPFSPLAELLSFVIPPPLFFLALFVIVLAYLITVQFVKSIVVKKYGYD